ncbi:MAG: hypothetical protein ACPL1K_07325 [Candidatus Kryptoniota bacterium]
MKFSRGLLSVLIITTLFLGLSLPHGFAVADEPPAPCPPDVQGKVISITPETHSIIIEQEDATQCTASLTGGSIQPVSALLSYYFGVTLQEINDYHAQGLGYGVLVKLYALANASGTSISDLVTQFKSGTGMGKLFKTYGGKPATVGVGQLKQKAKPTPASPNTPPGLSNSHQPSNSGLDNAASHNNSHNPKFNPTPVSP